MTGGSNWFVYMLQCADDTLYTGITTDPGRREREHNTGRAGARYTRARRPVILRYSEAWPDRASASRREAALKKLPRAEKLRLLESQPAVRR